MKHLLASLLTLGLLAACTNIFPVPSTPTPTAPDIDLDRLEPDLPIFREGLVASAQAVLPTMQGAPMYRLTFEISNDLIHVQGHEDLWYTNREDVPLDEIQFRLFPNILGGQMTVSNVAVGGLPVVPQYGLSDSLMIVPLKEPLAIGERVTIRMDFALEVPTDVELNYGVLAYADQVLTLAHAYPMVAVYDDEGWNAEIPPQAGDLTYADASFFLVMVSAPKDVTMAGSGVESAPVTRGQQVVQHVAVGPARDFFLAVSREFEVISQTIGEVTVNSYAPKHLRAGSEAALHAAARAIETFNKTYSPYPYTEFDVIATPTLALGVEYPGATAIAQRLYTDEAYAENTASMREATVVHEAAHQWFYNLIGNDQLDDPWLDESLTQFATWEYFRLNYGEAGAAGFEQSLRARWARVDNAAIPIGRPVAAYQGREYGAIVYGRGAFFFDALRDQMGADTFEAFLKHYATSNAWQTLDTEAFQSLAEGYCSCELDRLFAEWVY